MPVKFIVTKESDAEWRHECQFEDETITIGRNNSNDLVLDDPNKVVSRKHATIKREGPNCVLVDLGSRNSTTLNENKIDSKKPYPLESGDQIKIGDFVVHYFDTPPQEEPQAAHDDDPSSERTVLWHNPFTEEVLELKAAFKKLQDKYGQEDTILRKSALEQALTEMLIETERDDVGQIVVKEFAGHFKVALPTAEAPAALPAPENNNNNNDVAPIVSSAPPVIQSEQGVVDVIDFSDRQVNNAVEMFINATISMVKEAWKFRSEFIGIATIESQGSLHSATTQQLKDFLFDPELSDSEAKRRLVMIKMQIDELQLHYQALQSGYKSALKEGPQKLLQMLDPVALEKHFGKKANGMLPFYAKVKVYESLKQKINEIQEEGTAGFEHNILRPAFIERYMRTMSGAHRQTTSDSRLF